MNNHIILTLDEYSTYCNNSICKTNTSLDERNKLFNKIINEYAVNTIESTIQYLNNNFNIKTQDFTVSNIITGIWSGIPRCCNYAYSVKKINYTKFKSIYNLTDLDLIEYEYVPCISCVNNKQVVKIKYNGSFSYNYAHLRWNYIQYDCLLPTVEVTY